MADKEDKKHPASGKRLGTLRSKGNILRSKDFSGGFILLVAISIAFFMSTTIKNQLLDNYLLSFNVIKKIAHYPDLVSFTLRNIAYNSFMLLAPFFVFVLAANFLSPFLYGGWNFTLEPLMFKFDKLNIITNLINLFSKKMLPNLLKALPKLILLLGIFLIYLYNVKNEVISLMHLTLPSAINHIFQILKNFVIWLSLAALIIIVSDAYYSHYEYFKENKMTDPEVKDEQKDTEGNMEVKGKRRQKQIQLFKQLLRLTVPKAHVIVTNPTHYAIALRYDANKDHAPRVVAKGKDVLALQIRQLAVTHQIPIYQAPELARAIYFTSAIGADINPELYMAVAIVLSYVHQLKNYQNGIGAAPQYVSDLKIPKEFIFRETE